MASQKPVSRGVGPEEYTLFFPYRVRDDAESFDLNFLLSSLKASFPNDVRVDGVGGKGINILKISGFRNHAEGMDAFNLLKRVFIFLAIENDLAIHMGENLAELEEPFAHFPSGWQDGIDAGWLADSETDLIKIDGVAYTVFPVIIPEHKKIVDSGMFFCRIQRRIRSDLIPKAIEFSRKRCEQNNQKTELAVKAYINAFSHENTALSFLSLVTCLEIISEPKFKNESFISVTDRVINLIGNMQGLSEAERAAAHSISSNIGGAKKQSVTEALEDLIDGEKELISSELSVDHPFKNNPKGAVREMYKIRSNIAHRAQIGKIFDENFHRSMQFAHCSAKVLLKKKLAFI